MLGLRFFIYVQMCQTINCSPISLGNRAETVHLQENDGYLPFTKTIGVKLEQIQDFVCPEKRDFTLYLVSEKNRDSLIDCKVDNLLLLHHCVSYRYSKFTLYYSPMTPSGSLEFESGAKYWIVSSDCSVQLKIYVM